MEQTPLAAGTARFADGAASQSQTVTRSDRAGQLPAGTDAPRSVLRRTPGWVPALAVYLVLAVVSWWHVWAGGHPDSTMTAGLGDPSSFVWFLEWPAYALRHGHSLFLETRDQVPGGMNMLDNTSVLALGVVLAPVTWLFGPVATLNVALTAAPALSAISAYGCLRRGLGLWQPAAFVAGLLFGFSPFVQRNQTLAHLQVTFLALVPLIFLCAYELIVAQRGKWWRWGLILGVLVGIQFFIGSEILTMTTLTVAGSAVLVLICAAVARRNVLRQKLPFALRGLVLAAVVAGAILAYPVHFAIAGPDHITGSDWATVSTNSLNRILFPIAEPHSAVVRLPFGGYLGPSGLSGGYLGVAAILVAIVTAVFVRRPLSRLCLVITVMAEWASIGSYHHLAGLDGVLSWLPSIWRLVKNVPVLDQATPQNFSAIAVLAVAVSAALLLDQIWRSRTGEPLRLASARVSRTVLATGSAVVITAAMVVPWLLDWPMPYTTESVATPAPVSRLLAGLPSSAVVLFYPFPSSALDTALIWQAENDMRFRVVGGRGITAGPGGAAQHGLEPGTPAGMLSALSTNYTPHGNLNLPPMPTAATIAGMRQALRSWQVTEVVMAGGGRNPSYAKQWLTKVLGVPPHLKDGRWIWTGVPQLIS
ncbi:MAG: hypothetical protein WAL16_18085 [Streptosporangiaceae bacterium]